MRSRPFRTAFFVPADAPISQINTTPLIDVMLVLLIMVILTVPLATHAVKIDLPTDIGRELEVTKHRLAIDGGGRLFWDGAPIAEAALPKRLHDFGYAQPDGILEIQTEAETRYETFDRVLATVKRSGIERLGFVGNERFEREIR
jgi:biopolymer transport protein ExbD